MSAEAKPQLPHNIKSDVLEFTRLDDGLKTAREQTKEARVALEECRERIISYMRDAEIERLGIKKGTQYLELVEKTCKIRPNAECVKQKLQELMDQKITDPAVIYEELNKCGGSKQVWKLARRARRGEGTGKKKSGAPPRKRSKPEAQSN